MTPSMDETGAGIAEQGHTPEPWRENTYHGIEATDDGRRIDIAETLTVSATKETQAANARRIVACVNACATVPLALLEAGNAIGPGLVKTFMLELDAKDATLAALTAAAEMLLGDTCADGKASFSCQTRSHHALRTALARVRDGGAG